ncbi:DUF4380 domain-containing protein [Teredinibacter franksiae]|uniref:DUF4380 domain-containing protein n=1 Tax=Teredinibacter franksiae TaxID=2761453 RepID=UPI0016271CC7|nr:DUF4380 domain-containing protein [Teredinibacter franksiae]
MDIKQNALKLISCGRQISLSLNGGRITSFEYNSQNALLAEGIQTGSTFWPSPQSLWGWPPPKVLDESRYDLLKHSAQCLAVRSELDESLGIRLTKTIRPINEGIRVEYAIVNETDSIITMAPWEISRTAGGVTFYSSLGAPEIHSTCNAVFAHGHYWYEYNPKKLTGIPKIFANHTEGWLANVNKGLLFLKKFPQVEISEIAPGEAEVEIYAHADNQNPYIEIEQQGAFRAILPGMASRWSVDWLLYEIPVDVQVAVGSSSLLAFTKEMLTSQEAVLT